MAKVQASGSRARPDEPLERYNAKRDFRHTTEPAGKRVVSASGTVRSFVIQKHWASRLHYDFRLELDGVMVSWAVPKGPSFDPAVKQLAIHVEDHPVSYGSFEGTIPKGHYGAGDVIVWDSGTWEPVGDARQGMADGKLIFTLHGQKLAGLWELVRISKPEEKKEPWLLLKKRGDAWARPTAEYDVVKALPDSVVAAPLGPAEVREPRTERTAAVSLSAPDLSRAVKAPLPVKLAPQLATLVTAAPAQGAWLFENKFDGYRLLARCASAKVRLLTRNGNDWTGKLKALAASVESLGIESGWLDGEIVVVNDAGVPDFNRLQNAIDNSRSGDIVYYLFDVPFLGGRDLRQVPLASRRMVLQALLAERSTEHIRFSETFDAPAGQLLEAACRIGLEGVMLKRADAPYVSARSDTWLKLKCQQRQEFVVLAFTDRKGAAGEVGSLLLGYHENSKLRYAGAVGTGWSSSTGKELHRLFAQIEVDGPAIDPKEIKPGRWSKRSPGTERWVRPERVVEVAFGEWTPDGHLRHPTFKGLRTDKPGHVITRERAVVPETPAAPAPALASPKGSARARRGVGPSSVKVTHPDRVIDPSTRMKKVDLVHYYESIAARMLPHLASGGKGLHVVVPLAPKLDFDVVKGFSQAVVQHIAKVIPQRFVAKSGGSNRVGKIFVDYLRNGHGQTTAAAFSARARPGMGVSMPVSWEQLDELRSGGQWTIATAREYLSFEKRDPWAEYWTSKQTLPKAMRALGYTPKARATA